VDPRFNGVLLIVRRIFVRFLRVVMNFLAQLTLLRRGVLVFRASGAQVTGCPRGKFGIW